MSYLQGEHMSNSENTEDPFYFDEEKQEMVLQHDDLVNLRDFFTFFKIQEPVLLTRVLDECIPEPSKFDFKRQLMVRQALAETIAKAEHDLFKVDVFNSIRPRNAEIAQELAMRFELERILEEEANKNTTTSNS